MVTGANAKSEPPSSTPFSKAQPTATALTGNRQQHNLRATQRHLATPEQRDRALLVRGDSKNAGQVINVEGPVFNLGRHPDNQACVNDDGISRFHARITVDGSRYWVQDLDSSNGTYINGRRVTSCELNNGDTLNLGPRVCFRFSAATELEEKALKRLYEASVRDPLTGAYNRHFFSSQFSAELAYAVRHKAPLSVILIDVDFFKKVNDTYGHLGGDAALVHLAREFDRTLRTEDLLARYGGEEFVLLLRGINLVGAAALAERLRAHLAATPASHAGVSIPLTASFGCASVECVEKPTPESVLELADRRLYVAKENGRNRVEIAGP